MPLRCVLAFVHACVRVTMHTRVYGRLCMHPRACARLRASLRVRVHLYLLLRLPTRELLRARMRGRERTVTQRTECLRLAPYSARSPRDPSPPDADPKGRLERRPGGCAELSLDPPVRRRPQRTLPLCHPSSWQALAGSAPVLLGAARLCTSRWRSRRYVSWVCQPRLLLPMRCGHRRMAQEQTARTSSPSTCALYHPPATCKGSQIRFFFSPFFSPTLAVTALASEQAKTKAKVRMLSRPDGSPAVCGRGRRPRA